MTEWKQTGKGEHVAFADLPTDLEMIELDQFSVTVIATGDFDGFVYVGRAWSYNDGAADLDFVRYPAELVVEAHRTVRAVGPPILERNAT